MKPNVRYIGAIYEHLRSVAVVDWALQQHGETVNWGAHTPEALQLGAVRSDLAGRGS